MFIIHTTNENDNALDSEEGTAYYDPHLSYTNEVSNKTISGEILYTLYLVIHRWHQIKRLVRASTFL